MIGTPGFAPEANSTLASRFLLILCRSTLVDYNCSSRKRPGDELSSVLKLRRTDTSWFVDKVVEVDQFKKSERRELLEALGKLREDEPPTPHLHLMIKCQFIALELEEILVDILFVKMNWRYMTIFFW